MYGPFELMKTLLGSMVAAPVVGLPISKKRMWWRPKFAHPVRRKTHCIPSSAKLFWQRQVLVEAEHNTATECRVEFVRSYLGHLLGDTTGTIQRISARNSSATAAYNRQFMKTAR